MALSPQEYRKTIWTHRRGTRASQPAPATVLEGTLYFVTDEGVTERSNGAAWESYSGSGGTVGNDGAPGVPGLDGADYSDEPFIIPGSRGAQGNTGSTGAVGATGPTILVMDGVDGEDGLTIPSTATIVSQVARTFGITIDGGGTSLSTGIKGYFQIPYNGIITSWTLLADQSGSVVIDIWRDIYANYPPTVADTITAAAKPTISAATKATDSTLTGWTKTFSVGDVFGFNVDSAATITRVTLEVMANVV